MISLNSLNISWSQVSQLVPQTFLLLITNSTHTRVVALNSSHYVLMIPEKLPCPICEVYKFSVTAIPVGATYTGVSCGAPSPVISSVIPALSDITNLESSVRFQLVKVNGKPVLSIQFEVGSYLFVLTSNFFT